MILEPGVRVGAYQIVRRLGRGATGVVYHATHPQYGDVALKILASELAEEETTRARFVREAHTLVRLRHRNIVTVFEGGVHDDLPYIAMELVGGATLADRLSARESMSLERKLDIVIQLCDGLQFAHERGVIHRDVKPANVWIMTNGGVKLLDFGTARVLGSTFTRRRDLVGSAAYMAPEQLLGSDVDGRADVFAAGAILYELLAGRRPFDSDGVAAVMNKILHETPAPLLSLVSGLPTELAAAVEAALQKDVSLRYQEAADFGSDLRLARYRVHQPVAAPSDSESEADTILPVTVAATVVRPREPRPTPEVTRIRDGADALDDHAPAVEAAGAYSVEDDAHGGTPSASPGPPPSSPHPSAAVAARVQPQIAAALLRIRELEALWNRQAATLRALAPVVFGWMAQRWRLVAAAAVIVVAVAAVLASRRDAAPAFLFEISSVPPGATIEVDGVQTGQLTPAALSLAGRPTRLRLFAAGYETLETPIAAQATDRPNVLAFTLRRLVRVESSPAGARIAIDGHDTGLSTPADIPVAPGSFPAVVLDSGDRLQASVRLTEDMVNRGFVSVVLDASRRRAADVRPVVAAPPPDRPDSGLRNATAGAEVDGNSASTGARVAVHVAGLYPFEISGCGYSSAAAAQHDFQAQAPCALRLRAPKYYLDQTRSVTAVAGRVEFTAPPLARVQLRSKYEGCTLLLNEHAVGSPPVDLELAAGTYRVVIQCSDKTYTIRALTIEPGQSSRRLDDFLQ